MLTVDLKPLTSRVIFLVEVERLWQGDRVVAGMLGVRPVVASRHDGKIVFVDLHGCVYPTGARTFAAVDVTDRTLVDRSGLRELFVFDSPAEFAAWLAEKVKQAVDGP